MGGYIMNNNLIFLSLLFVSCAMSNVQINAMNNQQSPNKSTGSKIWEVSKAALNSGLKLTARIGWETIKITPNFMFFPIKHLYFMGNHLGDAFKKHDFKEIICALYEGTALILWLGAFIFLTHGITVAAQFLARHGILATQTAAGFEIINKYTWMNPYFQSILGYIKTFTAHEFALFKDCMCSGIKNMPGCLANLSLGLIKASFNIAKAITTSSASWLWNSTKSLIFTAGQTSTALVLTK